MGDLSKLKIAVGQPEIEEGRAAKNALARERMVEHALDLGADLLVMPGSLTDEADVHLVVLNDSRIDVAGSAVHLEACGETYRIGLEPDDDDCDFAVLCDASPFTLKGAEIGLGPSRRHPSIILRPVGARDQDKLVLAYDGGTAVFDANGSPFVRLRDDFEEDIALVQFGGAAQRCQSTPDKLLAGLVKTLRRFDKQVLPFKPAWVIGLSGGLDSSIVAVLLTLAFGPDRVVGYNLATHFNSETTKGNAASLASALGIKLHTGSIEGLVEATGDALLTYGYPEKALEGRVLENVQARIRGHILSTFAAIEGGVVVNNGNRIECALGYATLYGDAIGALAPIGDLTKVQLFELAHAINGEHGNAVIPANLLPHETEDGYEWECPPSAELADGQRDPMKWFYHDWLIAALLDSGDIDAAACDVMEQYLDDRLASTDVGKWIGFYGLDMPAAFAEDLDWVLGSIKSAAFKRIQAPPRIALASPASVADALERQAQTEPSARFKLLRARL